MTLVNAFGNIALDATLQDLRTLQTSIETLNDTILCTMTAILEKMPRVTGNDQAAVSVETMPAVAISSGTVAISSGTVAISSGTVTVSNLGTQDALTIGRSQIMAGTNYIYSNVVVT